MYLAAAVTLAPVRPEAVDEWHSFIAELKGSRRIDWAQSQRRRGITRQVISFAPGPPPLAVIYTETVDAERAAELLTESADPFDEWLRSRLAELHDGRMNAEIVFDSAPKPGPWRGWR